MPCAHERRLAGIVDSALDAIISLDAAGRIVLFNRAAGKMFGVAPDAGRVLYIEDDPVNALLVQQMLARWPTVQVEVATDGATGLARACAGQPSLVLLDMQLPDMTGLDVLARLKADALTRSLPVVAFSASAMAGDVQLARAAGAADYWTKPVEVDAFLHGLLRWLQPAQILA